MLRSALEAGWCLARFAMRALTDPERTCWKLALHAGLLAGRGWAGGQRARVAGYDYENGPEKGRIAQHRSRSERVAGYEDMAFRFER